MRFVRDAAVYFHWHQATKKTCTLCAKSSCVADQRVCNFVHFVSVELVD